MLCAQKKDIRQVRLTARLHVRPFTGQAANSYCFVFIYTFAVLTFAVLLE